VSTGVNELSKYERNAIAEIHAWKNPQLGWFGQAMKAINWPLDKVGDAVFATPGIGVVIRKSIEGLTSVLNDAAQWSVRRLSTANTVVRDTRLTKGRISILSR